MGAGLEDQLWVEKQQHFLWRWEEGQADGLWCGWILEVDRMAFESVGTRVLGFVSETAGKAIYFEEVRRRWVV